MHVIAGADDLSLLNAIVRFAVLSLLAGVSRADDAVLRLHSAKSLRCTFTAHADTTYENGDRKIESGASNGLDLEPVTYDNINVEKGSGRIVASDGASDLAALWQADALWFIEKTPIGNLIITTVFPKYAEGTHDFIVLESRHSSVGRFVLGEQSSGTCHVLE
jgi:hypothetical protein